MAGFHLVTGLMGAGKTYYGAELIRQALKEGALIHTNIPLEWDKLREEFPAYTELPNEQGELVQLEQPLERLVKLRNKPETWCRGSGKFDEEGEELIVSDVIVGGSEKSPNLVVIDEASLTFDVDKQGEKSEKDRLRPIFQLIALSRHVGLDIYFLAQDAGNVNVKLRKLAATRTNCTNAGKMPFFGWIVKPLFGDFLRVTFAKGSTFPLGKQWLRFDPVVGASYKTHGMADSVGMRLMPTRKGKGADDTASRGKKGCLTTGAIALLVIAGSAWFVYDRFTGLAGPPKEAKNKTETVKRDNAGTTSLEPATPKKGGLMAVEWDEADEWPICSIRSAPGFVRISTRNGPSLFIGAHYMGERLESMVQHRGYYYFIGEQGRVVVARPVHPWEREKWRVEYLESIGAIGGKKRENKGFLEEVKEQL
jgi:hypothetical protein